MFKTLDLSQILLTLNDLRTEFTAVSEERKQVCFFFSIGRSKVLKIGPGRTKKLEIKRLNKMKVFVMFETLFKTCLKRI